MSDYLINQEVLDNIEQIKNDDGTFSYTVTVDTWKEGSEDTALDTVSKIIENVYGVEYDVNSELVQQFLSENNITDPNLIYAGDTLKLPDIDGDLTTRYEASIKKPGDEFDNNQQEDSDNQNQELSTAETVITDLDGATTVEEVEVTFDGMTDDETPSQVAEIVSGVVQEKDQTLMTTFYETIDKLNGDLDVGFEYFAENFARPLLDKLAEGLLDGDSTVKGECAQAIADEITGDSVAVEITQHELLENSKIVDISKEIFTSLGEEVSNLTQPFIQILDGIKNSKNETITIENEEINKDDVKQKEWNELLDTAISDKDLSTISEILYHPKFTAEEYMEFSEMYRGQYESTVVQKLLELPEGENLVQLHVNSYVTCLEKANEEEKEIILDTISRDFEQMANIIGSDAEQKDGVIEAMDVFIQELSSSLPDEQLAHVKDSFKEILIDSKMHLEDVKKYAEKFGIDIYERDEQGLISENSIDAINLMITRSPERIVEFLNDEDLSIQDWDKIVQNFGDHGSFMKTLKGCADYIGNDNCFENLCSKWHEKITESFANEASSEEERNSAVRLFAQSIVESTEGTGRYVEFLSKAFEDSDVNDSLLKEALQLDDFNIRKAIENEIRYDSEKEYLEKLDRLQEEIDAEQIQEDQELESDIGYEKDENGVLTQDALNQIIATIDSDPTTMIEYLNDSDLNVQDWNTICIAFTDDKRNIVDIMHDVAYNSDYGFENLCNDFYNKISDSFNNAQNDDDKKAAAELLFHSVQQSTEGLGRYTEFLAAVFNGNNDELLKAALQLSDGKIYDTIAAEKLLIGKENYLEKLDGLKKEIAKEKQTEREEQSAIRAVIAQGLIDAGFSSQDLLGALEKAKNDPECSISDSVYSLIKNNLDLPLYDTDIKKIQHILLLTGITSQEQLDEFLAKYSEN